MIGVDTNILVRFLTEDDPAQAALAKRTLHLCDTSRPAYVSVITLCELVWVLEQGMRYSRSAVGGALDLLLHSPHLKIEDSQLVRAAVARYRGSRVDFADALMALRNHAAGCETTLTFDRDAGGMPEAKPLTATRLSEMRG